jgi:hypothetical protein
MRIVIPRYEERIIGLPDKSFVFTNSERQSAACPRRHFFGYSENLKPLSTASVLRLGTAWHSVMEAVYRYWMEHDSSVPESLLFDEVDKFSSATAIAVFDGFLDESDWEKEVETLKRAVEGWIVKRGLDPYKLFRVIGVETPLAAPIVNPTTGRPFRPQGYLVRTDDGLREARAGEAYGDDVVSVRWPYYQVGRLDAIIAHRKSGTVWAVDHKFSSAPEGYLRNALYDPQLPGYCWLLAHNIREGNIEGINQDQKVSGFMYEVASSQPQRDPKVLKSGKLSVAHNARVPSWRFKNYCLMHGVDPDDYIEYIASREAHVDEGLYLTEWLTLQSDIYKQYMEEIYGVASKLAKLKREAAKLKESSSIYTTHPRVPICRLPGGSCKFKAPCFQDSKEIRDSYAIGDGVRWLDDVVDKDLPVEIDGEIIGRNEKEESRRKLGW